MRSLDDSLISSNIITSGIVKKAILALALLNILPACSIFNNKEHSDPESLKLINVLDQDDFATGHIKGSINISFNELKKQARANLKSGKWKKDTPLVIYCTNYSCSASKIGAQQLQSLGFTDVCAYEGGVAEWYKYSLQDSSYEVEGTNPSKYLGLYEQKPDAEEDNSSVCTISAEKLRKKLAQAKKIQ